MVDFDELSPEKRFIYRVNHAMMEAVEDNANLDVVAGVCINTARELYDEYGAGENYGTFHEFVVDVGFQSGEIEEVLDRLEAKE